MYWNGAWRVDDWDRMVNELNVILLSRETALLVEAILIFFHNSGFG